MKPLPTNQVILTWLFILPADKTISKWKKCACIALVLTLIVAGLTTFASSLAFVIRFMSTNLQETLTALQQAFSVIPMMNSIVVAFFFRHTVPPIFGKLTEIYEKYKDDESFRFIARANNKSEWLWKMYLMIFVLGLFVDITLLSIASVLIAWLLNGYIDATQLFHPFKFLLPWDQSTLIGYIGEIIFSILIGQAFLFYNGVLLMTFVSICVHHQAFYKVFRHLLCKLDQHSEHQSSKLNLCETIEFHNTIKSWFSETAEVFNLYLMIPLVCNVIVLAVYIFQFDQQIFNQFDINLFIFLFAGVFIFLSNIFLYCFLGKLASESYRNMAEALYDCNWHELPLDLQKYFILMIADAQIPQNYYGYGIITLNLETFCSLIRAVGTYYMMFKTVTTAE